MCGVASEAPASQAGPEKKKPSGSQTDTPKVVPLCARARVPERCEAGRRGGAGVWGSGFRVRKPVTSVPPAPTLGVPARTRPQPSLHPPRKRARPRVSAPSSSLFPPVFGAERGLPPGERGRLSEPHPFCGLVIPLFPIHSKNRPSLPHLFPSPPPASLRARWCGQGGTGRTAGLGGAGNWARGEKAGLQGGCFWGGGVGSRRGATSGHDGVGAL